MSLVHAEQCTTEWHAALPHLLSRCLWTKCAQTLPWPSLHVISLKQALFAYDQLWKRFHL